MIPFLKVNSLKKQFGKAHLAVDDVSFEIFKGETLGLVGESGSGKSTMGRCLLALEKPTSGEILYQGKNLLSFSPLELFQFRRQAQMIFQDPGASMNPRMTLEEIIAEPLEIHGLYSKYEMKKYIARLLDRVGLSISCLHRFPHELSGGQRQRIVIARAIALRPQFIICDEPLSALDVSLQAQIVNLLKELQKELQLTYLFISHDLSMIKYISDRVAVMLSGRLVEIASTQELYQNPVHPFTKELISVMPCHKISAKWTGRRD